MSNKLDMTMSAEQLSFPLIVSPEMNEDGIAMAEARAAMERATLKAERDWALYLRMLDKIAGHQPNAGR